ncbi:MAG: hypothetical protein L3V56_06670 [Candidatus Magnetoovum sp. WYHC-5]|nr:hypothetical protein [Candidatus Magnetoovum sp. WYHC-5]
MPYINNSKGKKLSSWPFRSALVLTALILIYIICPSGLFAEEEEIPESHPVELTEKPLCTDCHQKEEEKVGGKPFKTYNHSGDYIKRHQYYAEQGSKVCQICHKTSFCTNCHAYKEELMPSTKDSIKPERWLPHRNNYIFTHRIDGAIDPSKCFPCHGRQNNQRCKQCHK